MYVATDSPARKPFLSNSQISILPFHIPSWRRDTMGLTHSQKGMLADLKALAAENGGVIRNDDAWIARAVNASKANWLKVRKAISHLFRVVGDMLTFPSLIQELDRLRSSNQKRSESMRAYHQKNTPRVDVNYDARAGKKSNEINDGDGSAPVVHHKCTRGINNSKGSRDSSASREASESCQSQAPDDPMAGLEPQTRSAGAGPSKPASGAGCNNPDPQPAESQEEDLPKNSAQKGSGRREDLDNPRCRGSSPRQKAGGGYPPEFERFWETCPGRIGGKGGKAKPFKVWRDASPEVRAEMQRGAEIWAKRTGKALSEYTPMVITWVNQRRWETESEADGFKAEQKPAWQSAKEKEMSL